MNFPKDTPTQTPKGSDAARTQDLWITSQISYEGPPRKYKTGNLKTSDSRLARFLGVFMGVPFGKSRHFRPLA